MCLPADSNVNMRGDKSFAYDLDVQRSIVSSRVALLLRSIEVEPLLFRLGVVGGSTRAQWRGWGEVG